jgi:hypothetical protein
MACEALHGLLCAEIERDGGLTDLCHLREYGSAQSIAAALKTLED